MPLPTAAKGWILLNKVWAEPRELHLLRAAPEALAPGYRLFRVCRDGAPQTGEPVKEIISLGRAEVAWVLPELSTEPAVAPPPVIGE